MKLKIPFLRTLRVRLKLVRLAYKLAAKSPAHYAEIEDAARTAFEALKTFENSLGVLVKLERELFRNKTTPQNSTVHELVRDLHATQLLSGEKEK